MLWVSRKLHSTCSGLPVRKSKASALQKARQHKEETLLVLKLSYKQQTCARDCNLAVNDIIVTVTQGKYRWADCAPTRHGAQFATAGARRGKTEFERRCRQQWPDGCTHGQRGPLQYCGVDMPLCGCWEIQAGVVGPGIQPNDAVY